MPTEVANQRIGQDRQRSLSSGLPPLLLGTTSADIGNTGERICNANVIAQNLRDQDFRFNELRVEKPAIVAGTPGSILRW